MVVKVDNGSISILNQQKFGLDLHGALIMKDIQPKNNNNWVKCKYKKPLVGMDHRTTIIRIAKESPTFTMKSDKGHVVFENMPLFLECEAKGYPVPWVAWIWNDQVLQNNTDRPTYLLRRHVTRDEAGNYTCMAGNSAGNTSFTYQVTIKIDRSHRESKAPPGTHSTESKTTSEAAPTESPSRESKQGGSSLDVGLGTGIPIAFAAGFALAVLLACCCLRRQTKHRRVIRPYEVDLSSDDGNNDDQM
ncbi:hypothetical protein ACROYT_G027930 [Oculina patagonica]